MYYTMTERENLIGFLPPGGVAAEIGVAFGDFAKVIVERTRPSRLHLIDPWSHEEAPFRDPRAYLSEVARKNAAMAEPPPSPNGDAMYKGVRDLFAGHPEVTLHRQYSYKIAREFPAAYFDFIYVDGNHTYEYVLQDLLDFAPKVKDDGLIIGHDFFEDEFAKENSYGVIDAVNRFLHRSKDFQLACLTYEPFPSFVLARKQVGFAGQFFLNLLESDVFMVEVPNDQAFRYEEKQFIRRDGRKRRIPSFAA